MNQEAIREQCRRQEQQLTNIQETLKQVNHKYNQMSLVRLMLFLGMALGILLAVAGSFWWGWLLAVVMLAGFLAAMKQQENLQDRQQYLKHLLLAEDRQYKRLQGEWMAFPETGEGYMTEADYVSGDLDIFGQASLYQLLCVAHTKYGKRRLAEVLKYGEAKTDTLRKRQEAVKELQEKPEFVRRLEALAWNLEQAPGQGEAVNPPSGQTQQQNEKALQAGRRFILAGSVYTGIFLIVFLGAILQWWTFGIVLILFFTALGTTWIMSGYCGRIRGNIFEQEREMRSYLRMMQAIREESFVSPLLLEIQQKITGDKNAMEGIAKLEKLLDAYNICRNPIVHWLLSGVCLYDLFVTAGAAAWRNRYEEKLQEGIKALGELEMTGSLAILGTIRTTTMPVLLEQEQPELTMAEGRHPLIAEEEAVANTIRMKEETVIITGSNMSGKTTFLRSIGMNMILANAGAAVCAEEMQVSRMKLFTSMRVSDDVSRGISTFYAELLRIKEMVEYGKSERPMLCLIDEIFKGTNSADRIVGAEAVIRKLTGKNCLTMVSTHDFELCRLAENYHFEEFYTESGIRFDYRLKRGMCTTTNALYLLKMAGLTENEK